VEYALQQSKSLALDRLSGKSGTGSKKSGGKKDGGASASVDLTIANFDKLVIQSDDIWLVEFFAPWYTC
jgi:protein disulfide-isomerase A6